MKHHFKEGKIDDFRSKHLPHFEGCGIYGADYGYIISPAQRRPGWPGLRAPALRPGWPPALPGGRQCDPALSPAAACLCAASVQSPLAPHSCAPASHPPPVTNIKSRSDAYNSLPFCCLSELKVTECPRDQARTVLKDCLPCMVAAFRGHLRPQGPG